MCDKIINAITSVFDPPKAPSPAATGAPDGFDSDAVVKIDDGQVGSGSTGQVRLSGKKRKVQKELPGLGL